MKIDYKDWYDQAYWEGSKTYKNAIGQEQVYRGPALEWSGWKDIALILRKIFRDPASVLDIGCSSGELVSQLTRDPYGIEISQFAIDHCVNSMKGRIAYGDISTQPELPGNFPSKFSLVTSTDLMEHIYREDLDSTFNWMKSKCSGYMFLLIATADTSESEFVVKKGDPIPVTHESVAVSGHIHVKNWRFWAKYFEEQGCQICWPLMYRFHAERERIPWFRDMIAWGLNNTFVLKI